MEFLKYIDVVTEGLFGIRPRITQIYRAQKSLYKHGLYGLYGFLAASINDSIIWSIDGN